eukprot:6250469-Lingulodinium_polyedra.AAC.1
MVCAKHGRLRAGLMCIARVGSRSAGSWGAGASRRAKWLRAVLAAGGSPANRRQVSHSVL